MCAKLHVYVCVFCAMFVRNVCFVYVRKAPDVQKMTTGRTHITCTCTALSARIMQEKIHDTSELPNTQRNQKIPGADKT